MTPTHDQDTIRNAASTPPPPYDSRSSSLKQLQAGFRQPEDTPVTTLLGSSVLATAQMLGYELPSTDVQDEHDVLQQKSHHELFQLLRNAEQVIRAHETGKNTALLKRVVPCDDG
jgi:hypothetical protein